MNENYFLKHFEVKIEIEDKKKDDKKEKIDCDRRTRDDVHRDIRYKMFSYGKIPMNFGTISMGTLAKIGSFSQKWIRSVVE